MAEWLGKGLQNLVQRFESASDLQGRRFCDVLFLSRRGLRIRNPREVGVTLLPSNPLQTSKGVAFVTSFFLSRGVNLF